MNRTERLKALITDVDVLAGADGQTLLASLPQWDSLAILLVLSHYEHVHKQAVTGLQIRSCRTLDDLLDLHTSQP